MQRNVTRSSGVAIESVDPLFSTLVALSLLGLHDRIHAIGQFGLDLLEGRYWALHPRVRLQLEDGRPEDRICLDHRREEGLKFFRVEAGLMLLLVFLPEHVSLVLNDAAIPRVS